MVIPYTQYIKNFVWNCDLCKPTNFRIISLRDGKPYTGNLVTIDAKTKNIIVDTRRPMVMTLGIEAYYGTEKETDCFFIKPMKFALSFRVCGDETLRLNDRSPMEVNVTLGVDKNRTLDLNALKRQFSVSNPMCDMKIFLARNLTVKREDIERKPEMYDSFLKLDNEKGKFFINHTDWNCTKVTGNSRCEGMQQNITLPMFIRAVTLGNKTVAKKVTVNFNYKWTNSAPRIDNVKKFLKVKVKEEDIEKGLSNKFVSYVSNKAYDREKDTPIITIKGGDLPCKCARFL